MTAKKMLRKIEEVFVQKLQAKTEWERDEALLAYKESVIDVLSENVTLDTYRVIPS